MGLLADYIMFNVQRNAAMEDEQRRQAQYQGLLERYQMPAEGPVGPQGQQPGYEGFNLSPGFFAEAANIPGYEGLAQGAQSQAGAMARQQQAQQYGESAPLTPFQQAQLDQRQATLDQARAQWGDRMWMWGQEMDATAAAAQGQPGMPGAQVGSVPQGQMMVYGPDGMPMLVNVPGGKQDIEAQGQLDAIGSALQSAYGMRDFIDQYGSFESGPEAVQYSRQHRDNIMAGLQQLNQMGVLNEAEYQRYLDDLPDPSSWRGLFQRSPNAKAAYQGVVNRLQSEYDRLNKRLAPGGRSGGMELRGTPPVPTGFQIYGPASGGGRGTRG
jgi:hypothetical protein